MARVLIVEDDKVMQKALRDAIVKNGYSVSVAAEGEEGLKSAIEEKPDLILLDLRMPNMGGMEMLEKLRSDEYGKNAKVVILTNVDDYQNVADALHNQTKEYIVKSDTSLKSIIDRVKAHLGD